MSYPAYAEVKASGVEWLGDVPRNWAIKRMRYACQLNPTKSEVSGLPPETPVSFLPMEKVGTEGEMVLDENRALEDVLAGFTYFRNEDIITAKITPCFENGKGAIVSQLTNGIGFGSTEFHVLRPFRGNLPRFIYYLTKSHAFRSWGIASMYGAGGQKRVPEDFIEDFRIGFPPLPEQHQIAAFLDRKTAELDAVLRFKERQLELLAEKRQALISQAVTRGLDPTAPLKLSGISWLGDVPGHWKVKRLRHVIRDIMNGTTATQLEDGESECPVTRIETISTGTVNLDKVGYIECSPNLNEYLLRRDDILFSHINSLAMVGNCAIYEGETPLYAGMNLLRIRPNNLVMGRWLWNWIRSSGTNQAIKAGAKPAINQVSLPLGTIKDIPVFVPPPDEQKVILTYLDRETAQIDNIAQAIRAQIEKVREYRQALISAAVTGKIDVRKKENPSSFACQD